MKEVNLKDTIRAFETWINTPVANKKRIVVFTGAGVSADSGIATFRDADGLWANYRIEEVCTPEALKNNRAIFIGLLYYCSIVLLIIQVHGGVFGGYMVSSSSHSGGSCG